MQKVKRQMEIQAFAIGYRGGCELFRGGRHAIAGYLLQRTKCGSAHTLKETEWVDA